MNTIIHQSTCPVCDSTSIRFVLDVIDHSVTKEQFSIWECADCTCRFTQDIPDQNSIGRYYKSDNYISHSNTDKGLINSLYHKVRKRTLRSKAALIQEQTKLATGSLLDVGAGTGVFASHMQQEGWKVTAVEADEQTRKNASNISSIELQDPAEMFKWEGVQFDAITLWHVLEHVHDLHGYLELLKKLLKPTGKLFIAVPNYTSYDAQTYGAFWAAYDVPIHLYHFSPRSMGELLKKHSLKLKKTEPMWFDSFYVSMLSEKYKKAALGLVSGVFTGAISNLKTFTQTDKCSSLIYVAEKLG